MAILVGISFNATAVKKLLNKTLF